MAAVIKRSAPRTTHRGLPLSEIGGHAGMRVVAKCWDVMLDLGITRCGRCRTGPAAEAVQCSTGQWQQHHCQCTK
jgi:hypothetical protein